MYWLEWRCHSITCRGTQQWKKLSPQSVLNVKWQWKQRWSCRQRDASHLATAPSRWRLHAPGEACRLLSGLRHHCTCFAGNWRQRGRWKCESGKCRSGKCEVDSRGGKCWSGKCRSDSVWKAVRRENSKIPVVYAKNETVSDGLWAMLVNSDLVYTSSVRTHGLSSCAVHAQGCSDAFCHFHSCRSTRWGLDLRTWGRCWMTSRLLSRWCNNW